MNNNIYNTRKSLLWGLSLGLCASSLLGSVTEMTPQELLVKAAVNNLDLQVQELEVSMNRDREIIAGEELIPQFFVSAGFDSSERRLNQREFLGVGQIRIFEEDRMDLASGIEGTLSYGTRYQWVTQSSRIRNSSNARADAPFRPEFQSSTRLNVTQPLLQGRGPDNVLAPQRVQRVETKVAELESQALFEQLTGRLLVVCWENQFALENIRVKEEALELAQSLLRENRRRVEEGMMADIDVTQAEVRVAEARDELIQARALLRERQNALWDLTTNRPSFDRPEIQIVGLEESLPELSMERMELLPIVMRHNPVYRSIIARAEADDIRLAFSENLALPQLDLTASLGYNGLDGSFGNSYRDFSDRDRPDWGLGLTFRIPLDRSVDEARVRESRSAQRQSLLGIQRLEMDLYSTLDNLLQQARDARERVELINESVRLAEEALRAEQRRLETGVTTTFNVLNQQRELSLVRTRALSAEVALQRILIDLHVLQGTLSERMGFVFSGI